VPTGGFGRVAVGNVVLAGTYRMVVRRLEGAESVLGGWRKKSVKILKGEGVFFLGGLGQSGDQLPPDWLWACSWWNA